MRGEQNHILFLGFGFCAAALVSELRQKETESQWRFSATCRTAEKAAVLKDNNIQPVPFPDEALPSDATHILVSAAPTEQGDAFLPHLPQAALSHLRWLGYLSTTGVYGDKGGALVNEETPTAPTSARGVRRVTAEQDWLRLAANIPTHIFRLAGIYGAGRNQLVSVQAGKARRIYKEGQMFSRIHVADIAQVLHASMCTAPNLARIYNVCDDMPAPPQDVVAYAARLLGVAPPPLIPYAKAELSPMARSFYGDSKRVDNTRIKQELGVRLRYPDYKVGLQALYETGDFNAR